MPPRKVPPGKLLPRKNTPQKIAARKIVPPLKSKLFCESCLSQIVFLTANAVSIQSLKQTH